MSPTRQLVVSLPVCLFVACTGRTSREPVTLRLTDLYKPELVSARVAPSPPPPRTEWRFDGPAPAWLGSWQSRQVNWAPDGTTSGRAVVLATRTDLERFLVQGAPHEHTTLLWPRVHEAKTFEALQAGGAQWLRAVDAHARIGRHGETFEVNQVQPN